MHICSPAHVACKREHSYNPSAEHWSLEAVAEWRGQRWGQRSSTCRQQVATLPPVLMVLQSQRQLFNDPSAQGAQ